MIELVDMRVETMPYIHDQLLHRIRTQRERDRRECKCETFSEILDGAVRRLCNYCLDSACVSVNARFLNLQGTETERQERLRIMVQTLADAFEKENVDAKVFTPNHFATLTVYYALFLRKDDSRPRNGINRWCYGLRTYIEGSRIEPAALKKEHLASSCLPMHYDASGVPRPAGLNGAGRAVASAPVTCELCHVGLAGHDKLKQHCARNHGNLAEYRKRTFFKAREAGVCELQPWVKRSMVQSFQHFRLHSVPSSFNDWTEKATRKAELRREEACAVCAVKDWLENRHEVYPFRVGTETTTWRKHFYDSVDANSDEENDEATAEPARGERRALLTDDEGVFCFGPRDKIHKLLDVELYATQWPLIPLAELHASSVQHPAEPSMRWLLHTRRVQCTPISDVLQHAGQEALPKSAGIGKRDATVWCCRLCVESLCMNHPKMPPLALANSFFGGRHHPLFREASMATRRLASSARLIMKQVFLGRGPHDECQKGMTGNTMLIAQPSPGYETVLPNPEALSEGVVVLFCKSIEDVSKAEMLVVNREQYREMVQYRRLVCPTFADVSIDAAAIDALPDEAVPAVLLQGAQAMPEAANVKTVMQGPANRIPMSCRQEDDETNSDADSDEGADADQNTLPPDPLNENETIIGINEESCPRPLRLFEAWTANMNRLNAEAAKYAQAEVQQRNGGEHPDASNAVKQIAAREVIRTSIAVDMIDIAQKLSRSSKARAELQALAAAQDENEQRPPQEALLVPTGKPLSLFDPSTLPAAYTEFLFGDCVPFLKRVTPVTVQQIFDALPSREELQYDLEEDVEPYRASDRSRWDTAEFYAIFSTNLRSLKLLQSVKASMDRIGFEKDFLMVASTTSEDFIEAVLHPSAPRSNEDLIRNAGNERVRAALRH